MGVKKICVITAVHAHNDVRIFHKECRALVEAGYKVVLLCPDFEGEEQGVICHRVLVPAGRLSRIRNSSRIFWKPALHEDADLYHIHDPELLPLAIRLRKRGKRAVYDVHEDLPLQILSKPWIPRLLRPLMATAARWYEGRAAARLTGVVCATQPIARRFPGSVLVANYPDPREYMALSQREVTPYLERPPYACYLGAISAIRGIVQMVEGTQKTPLRLQLAGRYESQDLRQKTEQMPGYSQVDYLGQLDRGQVMELMCRCRMGLVVLQPTDSYRESVPIKLLEYLLAGLPVIASDFPYWKELVGQESVLYVDPTSPDAIGQAMNFLWDNPQLAKRMGERGRELVLNRYHLQGQIENLLHFYRIWLGQLPDTDCKEGNNENSAD